MSNLFVNYLRYSLNTDKTCPNNIQDIDWNKMLAWAERQSVVGIFFDGILRAGKNLSIPSDILYKWIGYANLIENRNSLINKRSVELTDYLHHIGLESCVLKGQGNALMYPKSQWRTPGDIDVWTRGKDIRDIIRIARKNNPNGQACYHHVDYGEFNGVEVEIHYRPTFMNNLIANRRLQRWMKMHESEQFNNLVSLPGIEQKISVPTWDFNVVFQLSHIYRHVIQGGIGLRQMIDYYFLLKSNTNRPNDTNYNDTLQYLGLMEIAGAVMWVLGYLVYGEGYMIHSSKRDDWMICEPEEKRGKVLLAEIMKGGNFGHYDAENQKANSAVKKNIQRVKRDIRMMRYFPSECLWEPFFRLYHWGWRLVH